MEAVQLKISKLNKWIGKQGWWAFAASFVLGMITHLPAMVFDIPNHDGLDSMYFDQNMLTSGRWFLTVACGISSYYLISWLIGVLSLIYIGVSSVLLVKLLKVDSAIVACVIGGIMSTFPSLTSNFAYLFTMDGYMVGVLFAILAVYLVDKHKLGFLFGGIFLALSMGIYQAYLPIAMLLSLYMALEILAAEGYQAKDKVKNILRYLYMGVTGVALYYVVLKFLLAITGKSLASYQGMNTVSSANGLNILGTLKSVYADFLVFSLKGNVLFNNVFSMAATILLLVSFGASLIFVAVKKEWVKKPVFYVAVLVAIILIPLFSNIMLIISPSVTYHLLMRYQWVMLYILAIGFIGNVLKEYSTLETLAWTTFVACVVLIFCNMVTDNVAYSNLQKKYEKTYAYCLRLADRIEQTEGYYEGIPIYMIGVVGTDNYPVTDITGSVTDHMLGISGDYLLYTSNNYELFMKYYLGITFNFLDPDEANYYDSPEYVEMSSFPGADSTKVVNGVLYVKTENMH